MKTKKFTILHSNDMHGDFLSESKGIDNTLYGGLSLLSGYINQVRENEKNVIFTISGDMLQGSIIDSEYRGISTIEIMNYLAPDVVTLGNHELDYGLPHLLFLEKMANFPIVNANMYIKNCHRRLMKSHVIKNVDGFDVLFIGIITEAVLQSLMIDNTIGTLISLEEAVAEINRICDFYKNDDIDMTILLTHVGLDTDIKLAEMLDSELGVDMILGGHTHSFMEKPMEVNNILIAQAGCGTDQIGRFDVVVDDDTNSIIDWKWRLVPINSTTTSPDEGLQNFIDDYSKRVDDKYSSLLCRFTQKLTNLEREFETPLGDLFADIMSETSRCDFSLVGSGSIRCKEMGPVVSSGDLLRAMPYEDKYLRFSIRGKQVKNIFTHILRPENRNHDGECFQVNKGVRAVYRDSDRSLISLELNDKVVADDEIYTLGIQGFHFINARANLNISQDELMEISGKRTIATSVRNVIEEYLRTTQNINAQVEGRLICV